MKQTDVPPGYSQVISRDILQIRVDFCINVKGLEQKIQTQTSPDGVSVIPDECRLKAIVEWQKGVVPTENPRQWYVGFVQNLVSGEIAYLYQDDKKPPAILVASLAPERLPCKDSGSVATWYDPGPTSYKQFGVQDAFFDPTDAGAPPGHHRCWKDPNLRYVCMGDRPGSGRLPIRLPCRGSTDPRAVIGQDYTIGWRDPLAPVGNQPGVPTLRQIVGEYMLHTWLAISPDANNRLTKRFVYLYWVEWSIAYQTMVNPVARTAVTVGESRVTQHGPWSLRANRDPVLNAPDANDSACVRFRTRL